MKIPMVEIFQTVEGEGLKAGFPTTFVRTYNCNLRCTWCDTKYSYAPYSPQYYATLEEIVEKVKQYQNPTVCLTGGEPLMHGEKSLALIESIAQISWLKDLHIETNGSIPLQPFVEQRNTNSRAGEVVRFIMDFKLTSSGEKDKMVIDNFSLLDDRDEIKFVVGSAEEFHEAEETIENYYQKGQLLFSPVWDVMRPDHLVELLLQSPYKQAKLSLQTHKYIWHPDKRGV